MFPAPNTSSSHQKNENSKRKLKCSPICISSLDVQVRPYSIWASQRPRNIAKKNERYPVLTDMANCFVVFEWHSNVLVWPWRTKCLACQYYNHHCKEPEYCSYFKMLVLRKVGYFGHGHLTSKLEIPSHIPDEVQGWQSLHSSTEFECFAGLSNKYREIFLNIVRIAYISIKSAKGVSWSLSKDWVQNC